ncbi:MAG: ribosome maturation factor RimP [Anaeroplasmataceae bacterium]
MNTEKIESILKPFLDENDFTLFSITWKNEYGFKILEVLVDKAPLITLDELAKVNGYLSEKLDEFEDELPEYMLEVSSPGAEKPLRSKDEIIANIDNYINVKTETMEYEGFLKSFNNDTLELSINVKGRIKKVSIPYNEVLKIRLAVKF